MFSACRRQRSPLRAARALHANADGPLHFQRITRFYDHISLVSWTGWFSQAMTDHRSCRSCTEAAWREKARGERADLLKPSASARGLGEDAGSMGFCRR